MDKLFVVKIGGNIIENSTKLESFLQDFSELKGFKILIHGGGKKATAMANKLNIPVQMIEGRRITDEDNLNIITMMYGGEINKNIVVKLQALNCNAIGLSGADGNLISAVKRSVKDIDYGFVGDITEINLNLFLLLLENALTPVCCAISHDKNGQLLNTNADTIASSIAKSLSSHFEVSLWYCFEKNGVLGSISDEQSVIELINPEIYDDLKSKEMINLGMIPKIDNCFDALKNGVNMVKIGSPKMIKINEVHTTLIL
ncbi:MAG: acetylglutamate kinase [Flavobacteriaceae bacterium]|nr:acetylglutamate kinase [Flavobacteriaceae bacterium]